jgi:cell division protein FtsL
MYHFQQYIHLNPADPDAAGINEAIDILQKRLQTFGQLEKVSLCIYYVYISLFYVIFFMHMHR